MHNLSQPAQPLMTEHSIQRLLVAWFRKTYPHLAMVFFAIPNGGRRNKVTAAQLKDEGVLPGVPDLMLAVPSGGKPGLFLELKTSTGRASRAQQAAMQALAERGYAVELVKGYEAAKAAIVGYLGD
jgi:hypothetical protein